MQDAFRIRLLVDPPLPGAENMARDETLLATAESSADDLPSPVTLRLYRWSSPTISLGYFQPSVAIESLDEELRALDVVRRLTGGGAILHDLELTYSLTMPIDHPLVSRGPNLLYEDAHAAVIASLSEIGIDAQACGVTDDSTPSRGPFFCFARRHAYDVVVAGEKIAGSAQRRTRGALLQHGSIILGRRFDQQPAAETGAQFEAAADAVANALPGHLAARWSAQLMRVDWSEAELARASSLRAKYEGEAWTRRT